MLMGKRDNDRAGPAGPASSPYYDFYSGTVRPPFTSMPALAGNQRC